MLLRKGQFGGPCLIAEIWLSSNVLEVGKSEFRLIPIFKGSCPDSELNYANISIISNLWK